MTQKSTSLKLPSFNSSKSAKGNPPESTAASPDGQPQTVVPSDPRASAQANPATLPWLPKAKRPSFSSHRNDANAALALDLLADVERTIKSWHQALRQTLLEIQQVYRTGPIVDGWLEAIPRVEPPTELPEVASIMRHGDAQEISEYVSRMAEAAPTTIERHTTQYRLCSLDTDGRMQCQLCPPEQLGVISQAIARHQHLRQLLSQKHYLEARLKQSATALEKTRLTLGISAGAVDKTEDSNPNSENFRKTKSSFWS